MSSIENIKLELGKYANLEKVGFLPNFFKAVPGGYGEGDRFINYYIGNFLK